MVTEDNRKAQGLPAKGSIALSAEDKYHHDNQALSLQVESLQSQIQEQAKLAKEQVCRDKSLRFNSSFSDISSIPVRTELFTGNRAFH